METLSGELRIHAVVERLEHVLAAENAGIGRDPDFDVKDSNQKKSRCLYELTQLSRSLPPSGLSESAARRLAGLRPLLAANEIKLAAHVDAVRSVAKLIKDAMQAAEADGTYSVEQFSANNAFL